MIKEFFGFTHIPFTKEISTDFVFPSEQHKELTARLKYAIENRYFSLVTGEIGAGKSTATAPSAILWIRVSTSLSISLNRK